MIATIQRLTIASYGVPVPGALYLDKEDAKALGEEAPGGIISKDGGARRVVSVEFEEQTSESGTVVVTLEMIETASV